jgi:hypothetical protein
MPVCQHGYASFVMTGMQVWYHANKVATRMRRTKKTVNVHAMIPDAGMMSCTKCHYGCERTSDDDVTGDISEAE